MHDNALPHGQTEDPCGVHSSKKLLSVFRLTSWSMYARIALTSPYLFSSIWRLPIFISQAPSSLEEKTEIIGLVSVLKLTHFETLSEM